MANNEHSDVGKLFLDCVLKTFGNATCGAISKQDKK